MEWVSRVLAVLAVLSGAVAAVPSRALPPQEDFTPGVNTSAPFADFPAIVKTRQQDDLALRILPLGASIMSGQGSPEHSGMKKWVRMALRYDGYEVNMVGTQTHGTDMTDKNDEGVPGDVLTQIRDRLQVSLGYRANVVMINAGTNNANADSEPDLQEIRKEMVGMLTDIWDYDGTADTCIFLSTLLPTTHKNGKKHRIPINEEYRRIVEDYKGEKCIYLADMEPEGEGSDFMSTDRPIYTDDVHPNNAGHKRMAYVFYAAIHKALKERKIKPALPIEDQDSGCDKEFGSGTDAGLTQKGSGDHDGIYYHSSENMGVVVEIESDYDRNQWRFARLFSRDYDDLLGWYSESESEHRFGVWKNSADGQGNFKKIDDLNADLTCIPRGLHFIDMNADGLDDAVCIGPEGNLYLSINNADGSGDTLPSFSYIGLIKESEATQARVRLADIDGDGRGDYGVIKDNGDIAFWRNGWVDDKPKYWQSLGVRSRIKAPSTESKDFPGIRFEDINGDGRDDWMWLDTAGQTTTYTNSRSCQVGKEGDGLNVAWRQGFSKGESSGPTHGGMTDFQENDEDLRGQIHFARIYSSKPAYGNLGVQDYVFMEKVENGDKYTFKMRVWKNKGSGATKLKADGNKYCNMIGHEDGRMDYVWTYSTGAMIIYPNAGKKSVSGDESFWGPQADMWQPPDMFDRPDLHLADWDGDGDCDIIWTNPDNGNVRVWINNYPTTNTWENAFSEIEAPNLICEQKRGIGFQDLAVRLADITGNGRADFLCIEKDGKVSGSVQDDDGAFEQIDQIKFAQDMDRANLRWADVNGDGKDDMIWVNKFTGDADVWYNRGRGDPDDLDGSSFHWEDRQTAYDGNYAGSCIYYPDLDGNGRADQHSVHGTFTNEADTSLNPSCGLQDVQGDDPEGVIDPELPVQPGNPLD